MSQADDRAKASPQAEEAGERRVRQLLLGLLAIGAVLLATAVVVAYLKNPRYAYFAPRRSADLTYLLLWLSICVLGAGAAFRRKWIGISFAALLLLAAEGGSQLYYYAANGESYRPTPPIFFDRFQPHPLLVAVPREGNFDGIVHDAQHRRRTDNPDKVANPKYIFAFGGSTTYDIANDDFATWQSELSRLLGRDFAVENLGVPGYTSVENMIQSLFAFRNARPVCAVYFEGWNDLRNAHIRNLQVDYSDFHLPAQVGNLSIGPRPGFLTNNSLFFRFLASLIGGTSRRSIDVEGDVSAQIDPRLSAIFIENMKLIADIGRHFGVKVIFIPQMANYQKLQSDRIRGWLPFIRDKDLKFLLQAMDRDLAQAASQAGAVYLGAPLSEDWGDGDFVDEVHFSAAGARKFARSLTKDIADQCQ